MCAKVKMYQLSNGDKKELLGDFYTMFTFLKGREEVKMFLKDILSKSEIIMLSRRIKIAKLLMKGKTYNEIIEELNVGVRTISSVNEWLSEGLGDYGKIFRENEKNAHKIIKKKVNSNKFRASHPSVFALINTIMKD